MGCFMYPVAAGMTVKERLELDTASVVATPADTISSCCDAVYWLNGVFIVVVNGPCTNTCGARQRAAEGSYDARGAIKSGNAA